MFGEPAGAAVRRQNRLLPIGMLLCFAGFLVLSFLAGNRYILSFDLMTTRALQSLNYRPAALAMLFVSWPGYAPQACVIVGINSIILYVFGLHYENLVSLAAAILSQLFNLLAKIITHEPRPSSDLVHVFKVLGGYSYPSGHVMFYTVFFGFDWFLAFTMLKHSWKRTLLLTILGGLIIMVSVSRVYLGEHWASDVAGAYLFGGTVLLGAIQFYQEGKTRFFNS